MSLDDEEGFEESTVRPYTVAGGRTRAFAHLPLEALVEALDAPDVSLTAERRAVLELTARTYLSIAELSAHLHLPVGVVRVVVGDLSAAGRVRVHGVPDPATRSTATSISVLESVLDGMSAL